VFNSESQQEVQAWPSKAPCSRHSQRAFDVDADGDGERAGGAREREGEGEGEGGAAGDSVWERLTVRVRVELGVELCVGVGGGVFVWVLLGSWLGVGDAERVAA
jgi:hypothetical protein